MKSKEEIEQYGWIIIYSPEKRFMTQLMKYLKKKYLQECIEFRQVKNYIGLIKG